MTNIMLCGGAQSSKNYTKIDRRGLYVDVVARGQVDQSDYPWEKLEVVNVFQKLKN